MSHPRLKQRPQSKPQRSSRGTAGSIPAGNAQARSQVRDERGIDIVDARWTPESDAAYHRMKRTKTGMALAAAWRDMVIAQRPNADKWAQDETFMAAYGEVVSSVTVKSVRAGIRRCLALVQERTG